MPKPLHDVAAIVLAAGGSSRYGQCKQLVEINGSPLIRLAVSKLSTLFPMERINVVVGADAEAVAQAVDDLPVNIVINARWRAGLATSLRAGLNSIGTDYPAVMITLCDQALITGARMRQLLELWRTNPTAIAACSYAGTVGTPAIIPAEFYPQLLALQGDAGAKSILRDNAERLSALPVPEAEFDLDTPDDLKELMKQSPLSLEGRGPG